MMAYLSDQLIRGVLMALRGGRRDLCFGFALVVRFCEKIPTRLLQRVEEDSPMSDYHIKLHCSFELAFVSCGAALIPSSAFCFSSTY